MTDVFKLPVFGPADVFPMMFVDELAELAQDIKSNGLRHPIVVAEIDGEMMLVDGRNRRAACKLAGIDPEARTLNGEDPLAFVDSMELRRDVTTGQKAMAYAMRHPEAEKAASSGRRGGRGKKGATCGTLYGVPHQRVADARAILAYSPELAQAVITSEKALRAALDEVRQSQGSLRNQKSRLERLRDERPDLAELVQSEALGLDEAVARAKDEAEQVKQQRWAATMEIIDGLRPFDRLPETAAENLDLYDEALAESRGEGVTPARLLRASAYLAALAEAMEK